MKTAILYLGKRGAGVEFVRELAARSENSIVVIRKEAKLQTAQLGSNQVTEISIPVNLLLYAYHLIFTRKIYKTVENLILNHSITRLIVPMPTPFDVKLCRLFARTQIEIVPIVHDAKSHSGDFKLNNVFTRQICRMSFKIVCLSTYTKMELLNYVPSNTQVVVVKHPIFQIATTELTPLVEGEYFLIAGRIKRYKGVRLFIKAWEKFAGESDLLVIAGQGKIPVSRNYRSKIKIINRWLTNQEFHSLLYYSKVVVFPYRDATQSGILPMAMQLGKIIIITKAGALIEQSKNYTRVLVARCQTEENFIEILHEVNSLNDVNFDVKSPEEVNTEWDDLVGALSK